jgi:acetyl-CoA carboxylase carboxyl transferase subunit beta
MAWWSRTGGLAAEPKKSVPKGIWTKCERCSATLYEADLVANLRVCTGCQHHFRVPTAERIAMICDPDSWQEHDQGLESVDPLGFRVDGKKYGDQLRATSKKAGHGDAYRAATARVGGHPTEVGSSCSRSWAARWARSSARRSRGCSSARPIARRRS